MMCSAGVDSRCSAGCLGGGGILVRARWRLGLSWLGGLPLGVAGSFLGSRGGLQLLHQGSIGGLHALSSDWLVCMVTLRHAVWRHGYSGAQARPRLATVQNMASELAVRAEHAHRTHSPGTCCLSATASPHVLTESWLTTQATHLAAVPATRSHAS